MTCYLRFIFVNHSFSVPDERKLYVIDFYEQELTKEEPPDDTEEKVNVTCCNNDPNIVGVIVLCGGMKSCATQCTGKGLYLCPTGKCTGDPNDCKPGYQEEQQTASESGRQRRSQSQSVWDGVDRKRTNRRKFSPANLPSWRLRWCAKGCGWAVWRKPICCFHPTCWRMNLPRCKWLQNMSGKQVDYLASQYLGNLVMTNPPTSLRNPRSIYLALKFQTK